MPTNFYYVYALKDPRSSPARAFYIGKGTGSRAYDHLVTPDRSRKYTRIQEITAAGRKPLVDILVDNLSETEALRIEAELIAAFGTEETGGLLTNSVVPAGLTSKENSRVVVPQGTVEQAQMALAMLKDAVEKLIATNPDGIRNSDVAGFLGLRSDYLGTQKNYLSYSVIGLLLREGRVVRREGRPPRYISSTQA